MPIPSSETMWTSTDDCFCQEQVRQSRSPNSAAAQRTTSSADMASVSGSCRLGVAKQNLLEGVAAQAEPERLERDDFVGRDVAQVDLRAEVLDEPGLRGLRRRLPDQVVEVDRVRDLVDEPGAHLAGGPEDPGGAALARLGDHLPGACRELLLDPLDPLVGREDDLGVLRADLGQDGEVACEIADQLELAIARDVDGAVRDLDVVDPEAAQPALVVVQAIARVHDLEEGAADHDRLGAEHLELPAEVARHPGGAPAELDDVDVLA